MTYLQIFGVGILGSAQCITSWWMTSENTKIWPLLPPSRIFSGSSDVFLTKNVQNEIINWWKIWLHIAPCLGLNNKSCWIRRKNNSPSKIFVAIKFFMSSDEFQWRITKKIPSKESFQYVTRQTTANLYWREHLKTKQNKALQQRPVNQFV